MHPDDEVGDIVGSRRLRTSYIPRGADGVVRSSQFRRRIEETSKEQEEQMNIELPDKRERTNEQQKSEEENESNIERITANSQPHATAAQNGLKTEEQSKEQAQERQEATKCPCGCGAVTKEQG